jgi:hypothetical protein
MLYTEIDHSLPKSLNSGSHLSDELVPLGVILCIAHSKVQKCISAQAAGVHPHEADLGQPGRRVDHPLLVHILLDVGYSVFSL